MIKHEKSRIERAKKYRKKNCKKAVVHFAEKQITVYSEKMHKHWQKQNGGTK